MEQQVRRLVTRSDFDGLACAMMLKELKLIDEIKFVHPKDVQDGKVELSKNDITTNLPYDPRVSIAFDHHESEVDRLKAVETNGKLIIDPNARSAARVVYDYYGGKEAFPRISDDLMAAVDKGDSADFTMDEILNPKGWVLLHYLMDARTGLGRFHQFRISNYDLMMELIDYCLDHDIDEILAMPDVKERVDLYFEQADLFKAQLQRIAQIHDKVVVLDLRDDRQVHRQQGVQRGHRRAVPEIRRRRPPQRRHLPAGQRHRGPAAARHHQGPERGIIEPQRHSKESAPSGTVNRPDGAFFRVWFYWQNRPRFSRNARMRSSRMWPSRITVAALTLSG